MSNIDWGPAIKVDGKRPAWLVDADWFQWESSDRTFGVWDADRFTTGAAFVPSSWSHLTYIRLPADHPRYKQEEATRIMQAAIASNAAPVLDWSAPIEAVHEDGRVLPVVAFSTRRMDYCLVPVDGVLRYFDREAGTARSEDNPWRIRNVAAKPVRTAAEMLERLEALARRMALGTDSILEQYDAETTGLGRDYTEARAIVAEMTPPVDPDIQEARGRACDLLAVTVVSSGNPEGNVEIKRIREGKGDTNAFVVHMLAAIKARKA